MTLLQWAWMFTVVLGVVLLFIVDRRRDRRRRQRIKEELGRISDGIREVMERGRL